VLEITIDRDDRLTGRVGEAGGQRDVLPKLRARPTTLIRGSCDAAAASMASVPSRLPSLTNTISNDSPIDSSTGMIAARNAGRLRSSLYAGATIESTGAMASLAWKPLGHAMRDRGLRDLRACGSGS